MILELSMNNGNKNKIESTEILKTITDLKFSLKTISSWSHTMNSMNKD